MKKPYSSPSYFGRLILAAAAATLLSPTAATAQENDNDADIVVDGVRIKPEKHIPRLLDNNRGQIARFEGQFCPKVVGMPDAYAKDIEAKVSANAVEFGLTVPNDCKPNAVIVFTPVIGEYMKQLRKTRFTWFNSLSVRARRSLFNKDRAFYTWQDSEFLTRDGTRAIGREGLSAFGVGSNPISASIFGASNSDGSRIESNTREVAVNAFIVIDIFKTNNMSLRQLADFSTFHLLMNVDEDREDIFLPNSILNLFSVENPQMVNAGFTTVDKLTIKGLYNGKSNNVSAWQKSIRIARYVRKNYVEQP